LVELASQDTQLSFIDVQQETTRFGRPKVIVSQVATIKETPAGGGDTVVQAPLPKLVLFG